MKLKITLPLIILISLLNITCFSQNNINVSDKITISSNINIYNLIDLHRQKSEQTDEIKGYRIQITSNNDRSKIYALRSEVYSKFSDIKNYLEYDQPYYRLRIGDFKSRLDARSYLERVIRHFPSAFIVTDDIKVR